MLRMASRRLFPSVLLLLIGSLAAVPGCSSDGSAGPVDQKAALQKAAGGEGKSRLSSKAKAADDEAAKRHPKLH